ncbi:hypothetical protein THAOC_05665, partial [Thalassiosira oceanica]
MPISRTTRSIQTVPVVATALSIIPSRPTSVFDRIYRAESKESPNRYYDVGCLYAPARPGPRPLSPGDGSEGNEDITAPRAEDGG